MQKTTTHKESLSLVSGGGGVGKSHFIAAALELEPPSLRVSTPCAKMPSLYTAKNHQVTKKSITDGKESTAFKVLTDKKYTKKMIESYTSSDTSLSLKKMFISLKRKRKVLRNRRPQETGVSHSQRLK